jgi:hypothetical protein
MKKFTQWESFEDAKRHPEEKKDKPPSPRQIRKLLKSGRLTKPQAIELLQKYMDSLNYE